MDYLKRRDLGLLLTLDTLIETQGVTSAARKLGLSQPAVSAQLSTLRHLFDDPILVGNAHGMTPTPLAMGLRDDLRLHLDALNRLVTSNRVFDPATSERTFRILATDYTQSVLLIPFVAELSRCAPNLRVALQPATSNNSEKLAHGADLAVVSKNMTPSTFPARLLFRDVFRLVWRRGNPNLTEAIDVEQFCRLSHVLVSPKGGGFVGVVDDVLKAMGLKREVAISVPHFGAAIDLISRSDFCGVLPLRVMAPFRQELEESDPPIDLPQFDVLASWHARLSKDPGHIWLRKALAEFARDGAVPS